MHGDGFCRHVRIHLQIFNPNQGRGSEANITHNAVPISLRMIADAVGVFPNIHNAPVVHPDGERVFAGLYLSQIIFVRRGEGVIAPLQLAVQPHLRLPMGTFE